MQAIDRGIAVGWTLLGATLTIGVAAIITAARAQDVTAPTLPRLDGTAAISRIPRGVGTIAPVMTATDRYVFVLRGNTLYQFDTNGLKFLSRAELPGDIPAAGPEVRGRTPQALPGTRGDAPAR